MRCVSLPVKIDRSRGKKEGGRQGRQGQERFVVSVSVCGGEFSNPAASQQERDEAEAAGCCSSPIFVLSTSGSTPFAFSVSLAAAAGQSLYTIDAA